MRQPGRQPTPLHARHLTLRVALRSTKPTHWCNEFARNDPLCRGTLHNGSVHSAASSPSYSGGGSDYNGHNGSIAFIFDCQLVNAVVNFNPIQFNLMYYQLRQSTSMSSTSEQNQPYCHAFTAVHNTHTKSTRCPSSVKGTRVEPIEANRVQCNTFDDDYCDTVRIRMDGRTDGRDNVKYEVLAPRPEGVE